MSHDSARFSTTWVSYEESRHEVYSGIRSDLLVDESLETLQITKRTYHETSEAYRA